MPKFIVVDSHNKMDAVLADVSPSHKWEDARSFKSYLQVVDDKGNRVSTNSLGRKFQIVGKKISYFSVYQRIFRSLLGGIITVITCGVALRHRAVKNLLLKKYTSKHFAIPFKEKMVVKTASGISTQFKLVFPDPIQLGMEKLNFVDITESEKNFLAVVSHAPIRSDGVRELTESKESQAKVLFAFAKQPLNLMEAPYAHTIERFNVVLKKLNPTELSEFFKLIDQVSEEGVPALHLFNAASLLATLEFTRVKKIHLDLCKKDPQRNTIFAKWIANSDSRITRLLYEMDSTVLPDEKIGEYLDRAILMDLPEQANFLSALVERRKLKLPNLTECRRDVFLGSPSFNASRLKGLSDTSKEELYAIANAYGRENLVKLLRPSSVTKHKHLPGILSGYSDSIFAREAVEEILQTLRNTRCLLSAEEFSRRLDRSTFEEVSGDFGTLQGKLFLESVLSQGKFKGIKIRPFIAVWEGKEDPSFKIVEHRIVPNEAGWKFYRKKVTEVKPRLTLEEAEQIVKFLRDAGYSSQHVYRPDVVQITKEGAVVSSLFSLFCQTRDQGLKLPAYERWADVALWIERADSREKFRERLESLDTPSEPRIQITPSTHQTSGALSMLGQLKILFRMR